MNRHVFSHGDVRLACFEQGSGIPLVLIHGFPFDHTMWDSQIDSLSATCRVIAPDLRGFGESTLADEDLADGVEMHRYASDVLACLDKLQVDQPAILCGFSMGGYVLWQLALRNPERIGGLVLCDTRADADSDEAKQIRRAMAEEVLVSGAGPVADTMLPKLLAPSSLSGRTEVVDRVRTAIGGARPAAIAAAQRGMARRVDVRNRLAEIVQPALVVVGAEDAVSPPAEMQGIADLLPQSRFTEVPNAGHMTPLENATAVNEAIQTFVETL